MYMVCILNICRDINVFRHGFVSNVFLCIKEERINDMFEIQGKVVL